MTTPTTPWRIKPGNVEQQPGGRDSRLLDGHHPAPMVLDLFACEGVGARGYRAAGLDVAGIDLLAKFRRRYPSPHFFALNAMDALRATQQPAVPSLIHASPPCQAYSVTSNANPRAGDYPMLIDEVRVELERIGLPYVIENVAGARSHMRDPITLCGGMFGLTAIDTDGTPLRLERHRLFEAGGFLPGGERFCLPQPTHPKHDKSVSVGGVYGGGSQDRVRAKHIRRGGYTPAKGVREVLMGVESGLHTLHGLSQAIPPAYTHWIGQEFLRQAAR